MLQMQITFCLMVVVKKSTPGTYVFYGSEPFPCSPPLLQAYGAQLYPCITRFLLNSILRLIKRYRNQKGYVLLLEYFRTSSFGFCFLLNFLFFRQAFRKNSLFETEGITRIVVSEIISSRFLKLTYLWKVNYLKV